MGLFTLENNIIKIDPDTLPIPEFRQIWERDKDKTKSTAYKELCYVFYIADYKSPYQNVPEDLREEKVRDEFIRDKKWKVDKEIQLAIDKYILLQQTPTLRLLRDAKIAVDETAKVLRENTMSDRDRATTLANLGKIVESINKLEQQVKKEQTDETRIRGGGELKARER